MRIIWEGPNSQSEIIELPPDLPGELSDAVLAAFCAIRWIVDAWQDGDDEFMQAAQNDLSDAKKCVGEYAIRVMPRFGGVVRGGAPQ